MLCKKVVLRKFTGKQLCQSFFLIKLQASKRNRDKCFPVILGNICFAQHLTTAASENWVHTTSGNSQPVSGSCSQEKLSVKFWAFLKSIEEGVYFSNPSTLLKINSFMIIFQRFLLELYTVFIRLVFRKQLSTVPF